MVNGIDLLAVTNLDGLDTVERIKICTGYRLGGATLAVPPSDHEAFARCEPVYEEMPGWGRSLSANPPVRSFARGGASLPPAHLRPDRREVVHRQRRPETQPDHQGLNGPFRARRAGCRSPP